MNLTIKVKVLGNGTNYWEPSESTIVKNHWKGEMSSPVKVVSSKVIVKTMPKVFCRRTFKATRVIRLNETQIDWFCNPHSQKTKSGVRYANLPSRDTMKKFGITSYNWGMRSIAKGFDFSKYGLETLFAITDLNDHQAFRLLMHLFDFIADVEPGAIYFTIE